MYLPVVRAYLGARWRGKDISRELDDAVQEFFVECSRGDGILTRSEKRQLIAAARIHDGPDKPRSSSAASSRTLASLTNVRTAISLRPTRVAISRWGRPTIRASSRTLR